MPSVTVIICTHNPRKDYFARVLDALRRQNLALTRWELLLVDNGSDAPLAPAWDLSWHPNARHIRENEPGLTPARLRGIREAATDLLVFVDDDNALEPGYLEIALNLAVDWPKIGIFGGSQIAAFEEEPNDTIKSWLHLIAIRTIPRGLWTNIKGLDQATPRGAGLCFRRHLAIDYARRVEGDPLRKRLDRSGSDGFLSGGDTDMAWSVCDAGQGMLVTPALELTHYIDKKRLEESYLLKIAEGHAASGVLLEHIHGLLKDRTALVDYARECLRVLQAPTLFEKRLHLSMWQGRRKGFDCLRKMALGHSGVPIAAPRNDVSK